VRNLSQRIRTASLHIVLVSSGKAEEVEANKGIAGIADLIDNAASSDDAERSKPRPNIFQAAFDKLGFRNRGKLLWSVRRPTTPKLRVTRGSPPSAFCAVAFPRRRCARRAALQSTATRVTFSKNFTNRRSPLAWRRR
jgi:hypothetical protein